MGVSSTTKTNYVWKKIYGREQTTNDKAWYEEYPGRLLYVHYTELWTDDIPYPPPSSTTTVVEVYDDLVLTEDNTVSNHRSWKACSTHGDLSTQVGQFIPPRFGQAYSVRIFEDDGSGSIGNEIPTAHPSNWVFDYENGVLFFEHNPEAYGITTPIHIKACRYIGNIGSSNETTDNVDGGSASTVYLPEQEIDGGGANG